MQDITVKNKSESIGFFSSESFSLLLKVAETLCKSTLVPTAYRSETIKKGYNNADTIIENPNATANTIVALNMAQRMGADPLMVMQNLYIVEGRPAWSSQWIIAAINSCGRFSPIRFDIENLGLRTITYEVSEWAGKEKKTFNKSIEIVDKKCIAWAVERETGERVESPPVTIEMAVREGWYGKNGSKWKTMDEVMLRYRTASFFGKLYAPELLMGLQSVEEAQDIAEIDVTPQRPAVRKKRESIVSDILDSATEPGKSAHAETEPELVPDENGVVDGPWWSSLTNEEIEKELNHRLDNVSTMAELQVKFDFVAVGRLSADGKNNLRAKYSRIKKELLANEAQPEE